MCAEPNGRTTLFNYGWKELADVCLTDLSRAHSDIYDLTTRIDIMRWGHAMISPRPNFIWSGIREKAVKPYREYSLCPHRSQRHRTVRRSVLSWTSSGRRGDGESVRHIVDNGRYRFPKPNYWLFSRPDRSHRLSWKRGLVARCCLPSVGSSGF